MQWKIGDKLTARSNLTGDTPRTIIGIVPCYYADGETGIRITVEGCGYDWYVRADEMESLYEDHEHEWGPMESARFTGNPHRKCQFPGCREISLDLDDEIED